MTERGAAPLAASSEISAAGSATSATATAEDAFAPRLYVGHVMHMRLRPFGHGFRYRIFTALLDIDRLEETAAPLRWFRVDRPGLFSFRRRDHGPRDGSALRPWVERLLAEAGRPKPARIMLLSIPRLLGYAFNPLSIYYCHDAAGQLESVVYEVKNTFGDQHPYVLSAEDGTTRHAQAKEFYVSPFMHMGQTYRFTIAPPGARLAIRIKQGDAEGDWLIATQNGEARALTDRALLGVFAILPLSTFKIFAGIHWEALKLFVKGARFHKYPGEDRVVIREGAAPR